MRSVKNRSGRRRQLWSLLSQTFTSKWSNAHIQHHRFQVQIPLYMLTVWMSFTPLVFLSISRHLSLLLLLAANVVSLILLILVKETALEEKQLTSVFVGVIVLLKMQGEISKQQQQNSCCKLALNRTKLKLWGVQRQTDLKMSRQATQLKPCFFW